MHLSSDWKQKGAALDRAIAQMPRWKLGIVCYGVEMLVAAFQLIGSIPLTVFYAIPISILAWYAGSLPALLLSVFTVAISAALVYFANYPPSIISMVVEVIRFSFWAFLSISIPAFRSVQAHLHRLAIERELALANEVAAHRALEQDMLEFAERKQRGIGRDMHDGLTQHLIATAMIGYTLAKKLAADQSEDAEKAHKITDLIEQSIKMSRSISEALHPIEMHGNDLLSALEHFTSTTSELFGMDCQFECPTPVIVDEPSISEHLFRITQEAVSNAIRHGHATKINVSLQETDAGVQLSVSDNGVGLVDTTSNRKGMGLQIMAARSRFIGGQFSLSQNTSGGAVLVCVVPVS